VLAWGLFSQKRMSDLWRDEALKLKQNDYASTPNRKNAERKTSGGP